MKKEEEKEETIRFVEISFPIFNSMDRSVKSQMQSGCNRKRRARRKRKKGSLLISFPTCRFVEQQG